MMTFSWHGLSAATFTAAFAASVLGTLAAACISLAAIQTLPRRLLIVTALTWLLPCLCAALLLPLLIRPHPPSLSLAFWQGLLLLPACLLGPCLALSRLTPDTVRTARALGANARTRLRLIWLPILAPTLSLTTLINLALDAMNALMHGFA